MLTSLENVHKSGFVVTQHKNHRNFNGFSLLLEFEMPKSGDQFMLLLISTYFASQTLNSHNQKNQLKI
jgi:hypothetical protein